MKIKILAAFCFIAFNIAFAADAKEMLAKGNQLYQASRFDEAIETYQNIIKNGWYSEELYFNLGNAYFRTSRMGMAILYYEKALKLDPNDEDIHYNLRMANARTIDKIDTIPDIFIVRWWKSLLNAFTVNGWTAFAYIVYLLLIGIIALYFLAGRAVLQKWAVMSGALTVFVLAFSILMLALKYNNDNSLRNAIVTEPAAYAKLSPDSKSGDAFVIHEGLKVNLEDKVSGWVKIKLADGKVGWIEESRLGSI